MGICKNASAGGQGKALSALPLALGVVLALVVALGAAAPAYAATNAYTDLIPTDNDTQDDLAGKRVTFNGASWYVIGDDSTAQDAGTLTLFATDSLGESAFDESGSSNAYGTSTVKAYLDAMTAEGGSFHGVSSAIVGTDLADVGVTGAKLYLLSIDEVGALPIKVRMAGGHWGLRSPGNGDGLVAVVGVRGRVIGYDSIHVKNLFVVRPALKLDLGSVTFEPATKSFSLAGSHTQVMHRLYNPNSGEHFYTASDEERDAVVAAGWQYEGIGWVAPEEGAPVFRVYNPSAGDHHYTTSVEERDFLVSAGWNDEGIGWCSAEEGGTPLFRQYNPNAVAGAHNYTTSEAERDALVEIGWNDEGVGWYGVAA